MATYALLDSLGNITNLISWDVSITDWEPPAGFTIQEISSSTSFTGSLNVKSVASHGGVFYGNVAGTSTSSSFALTASYTLNDSTNKAGLITSESATTNLVGNYIYNVSFDNAYGSDDYAISVIGENAVRVWTIENKTSASFTINSNSNDEITGNILWATTRFGS